MASNTNLQRDNSRMQKHGSKADGTHAAHKLSYEVVKASEAHRPGPKYAESSTYDYNTQMGDASNLRIKTETGNLVTDRRVDAKLIKAIHNDDGLYTKDAVRRVHQIQSAVNEDSHPAMARTADTLVNRLVYTGHVGRPPLAGNIDPSYYGGTPSSSSTATYYSGVGRPRDSDYTSSGNLRRK
eukprot:c9203_g1_i1.p1 GENE.c9203_g1_i1~~c9203_g1_i1.p1  ORF type:complete len:183 (+),score=19.98 c9203_g1_i1:72-620(+)